MRPLLLTLHYVLIIAPAGRVLRLLGRDPLDRAVDRARDSYLVVPAEAPGTAPAVAR
ncbi:hypothetical protein [Streptomyces sp. NPDC001665]